jgi:hypothetical protein
MKTNGAKKLTALLYQKRRKNLCPHTLHLGIAKQYQAHLVGNVPI